MMTVAVVAVLGLPLPSPAVTAVSRTFVELVSRAELIVVADIRSTRSSQLPEGAIVTDLSLDIARSIKGGSAIGSVLTLRVLGGKVGNTELAIDGAPQLDSGQRVLLFIRGNMTEAFPFVGVHLGVFRLQMDPSSRVDRVFDWRGHPVIALSDEKVSVSDRVGDLDAAVGVDDFIREIQRRLAP
jgi:hypothetical protein